MDHDVIVYKLNTGEEIIGTLTEDDRENSEVIIGRPRQLAMTPVSQGQVGLSLLPWLASAPDEDVVLRRDAIVGRPIRVPKQLEDAYLQSTSGIQLATGNVPK